MPNNSPGFVQVKKWILEAAAELGADISVRHAKSLAGDWLAASTHDDYSRLTYADPVGEGVARRWHEFASKTKSGRDALAKESAAA